MPACRCPLWLKSDNSGVSPCPGPEFTLAQYSGNCTLFPSVCCWGCFAVVCWVLLWPYHPLPAHCTGSLLSYWVTCRYLTFLAVDWLRTVSASPPFFVIAWFVVPFPLSLLLFLICLSLSGLGPVLGVRAPPLSLPSRFLFLLVLSLIVYLPPGCLACPALPAVPAYLGSSLSFVFLGCLYPWVWCLIFLAVDWSRISSIVPSLPYFCLCFWLGTYHRGLLSLFVTSPVKTPVWYFWP